MPTQPFPIRKGESPPEKKTWTKLLGQKITNSQSASNEGMRIFLSAVPSSWPQAVCVFFGNMIIRVVTGSSGNPEGFQKIPKILVDFELESFGGRVSVLNSSSVGPPSRPGCMLTHMLISYLIKGRETTYGLWFGHLICLHEFLFGKLIELWTPWEGLTVLHPWKLRDGT